MKNLALLAALLCCQCSAPSATASTEIQDARASQAALRERALIFLRENMPEADVGALTPEVLEEHVDLALAARESFPWAAAVPEPIFFNDVLPYAVFDEPRDPWRRELLELARPLVEGCGSASEAAQALNRQLFGTLGLHYSTARARANQSYAESKQSGKASCTGLSIALVQACRAVGIPARAVGTPNWATKPGNHTWVEIWDGDWHFMGADEYDAAGLDRGWFTGDASAARSDDPRHRIYATSWVRGELSFPMVWSAGDRSVAAVDVTARYAKPVARAAAAAIFVRVFERRGGERIVVDVELLDESGIVQQREQTRAGGSDMNDMPKFELRSGAKQSLRLSRLGESRNFDVPAVSVAPLTLELAWDELASTAETDLCVREVRQWLARAAAERGPAPSCALTREQSAMVRELLASARAAELSLERNAEMEARAIALGERTLRWTETSFGEAAAGSRSLWISMHGGGGAPSEVNDQQWKNQGGLYQPAEGFYVAPRAPTDTWNLWHEAHIDPLFSRLIEDYVVLRGVDPDRVYLMGYSAGGDGVWQLAPRMADRFAAAAMMAGHPNEASLLSLRNLPFAIFMGADDTAYDRNKVARERGEQLDALRAADPAGYEHLVRIYEGLGHWMKRKDAEALPWMAERKRVAWPNKVVWFQDDVVHERFYWLARAPGSARAGEQITAEVEGRTIRVSANGVREIRLLLDDALLDLDQPIMVEVDGQKRFEGRVERSALALWGSLQERFDPPGAACSRLGLKW